MDVVENSSCTVPPGMLRVRLEQQGYAVVAKAIVPATCASATLPEQLRVLWPERFQTSSAAKKACRQSLVLVNGVPASITARTGIGEEVSLVARVVAGPEAGTGRRGKPSTSLPVMYEDDHLAVVSKPAGMEIAALHSALTSTLWPSRAADLEPLWRPQHVHRIDKLTSGLVVAAKTGDALRKLSTSFSSRQVQKRYRCVVAGSLHAVDGGTSSEIRVPLGGQEARTVWATVGHHVHRHYGQVTLVDVHPITGRKHQIRRHMAMLGHPILGDARYWPREGVASLRGLAPPARTSGGDDWEAEAYNDGVLCLAAVQIELPHPHTGEPLLVRAHEGEEWVARCKDLALESSSGASSDVSF